MKLHLKDLSLSAKHFSSKEEWNAYANEFNRPRDYYNPRPNSKPYTFPCIMIYNEDCVFSSNTTRDTFLTFFVSVNTDTYKEMAPVLMTDDSQQEGNMSASCVDINDRHKFCEEVNEICEREGFTDCNDLCYNFIESGVIDIRTWLPEKAAEYCMQMIEQA